jgi:methyl-accepting chemotaxis protein
MSNIKIRIFLPALFGILLVLAIAQGIAGMRAIGEMEAQIDNISRRMERATEISAMETHLQDIRRGYLGAMVNASADERKKILDHVSQVRAARAEAFQQFGSSLRSPLFKAKFEELTKLVGEYETMADELAKLINSSRVYEARTLVGQMTPKGDAAGTLLKEMTQDNRQQGYADRQVAEADGHFAYNLTLAGLIVTAVLALAAALLCFFRVSRPIGDITAAMNALAGGDNARAIPHAGRSDEIGEMAAAVAVFRENALERERLERETEDSRTQSEQRRVARDEQKAREVADVQFAVDGLGFGLKRLSDGDMTYRLDQPFAGQLDSLRSDYNESIGKLQATLKAVGENARIIDAGANEIRSAADDLSKRTEQQAASVEETAAALEEVTTAVKDSAARASDAGKLVEKTREDAELSGEVVRRTVVAVQDMEKSASEISNIIGVIDEIAFQTNLLALNAGVEAARAGEAGKGFAVVAQEVRELAQRSANAAKEIKALITKSGEQVRNSVDLVGKTGQALDGIVAEVQEINRHVSSIVVSTREQSTGLSEINTAVNTMDQGTQQNAAMVEQTTAASRSLAAQAESLTVLLSQFKLGEDQANIRPATNASRPQTSPARVMGQKIAAAFGGRSAAAVKQEWSEF